jgi:hypothetical protein
MHSYLPERVSGKLTYLYTGTERYAIVYHANLIASGEFNR